jgi:transcriptional regulator with XRE-family HTH domain
VDVTSINSRQEFARELCRLRASQERGLGKSLNRQALAKKISVSRASLYAYFRGTTLPGGRVLDLLLLELGASGSDLAALANARERLELQRHRAPSDKAPWGLPADVTSFVGRGD